jgi:hypothetical protein
MQECNLTDQAGAALAQGIYLSQSNNANKMFASTNQGVKTLLLSHNNLGEECALGFAEFLAKPNL